MRKFMSALCIALAIVIAVLALSYYFPKLKDYADNLQTYHDIKKKYTRDPEPAGDGDEEDELSKYLRSMGLDPDVYGPIYVDSEGLLAENEDYLGWIYVPLTQISYPVVQGVDNDEYLHADYYKNYNFAGTIFMDYRCDEGLDNHHTILYGHNMRIGTMFAGLNNFKSQDYIDERPIFWFITPDDFVLYVDFAVCTPNPYDRTHYGIDGYDFKTDDEYADAIDVMIDSSVVEAPIYRDVTIDDYIMSLSTCTGDSSVRCMLDGVLEKSFSIEENQHSYAKEEESETETESEWIDAETESESIDEDAADDIMRERIQNMVTENSTISTSYSTIDTAHGETTSYSESLDIGILGLSHSSGYSHSTSEGSPATIGHSVSYNTSSNNGIGFSSASFNESTGRQFSYSYAE